MMSNGNLWCRGTELNRRRRALQARALPTELPRHNRNYPTVASGCANWTGFETPISCAPGGKPQKIIPNAEIMRKPYLTSLNFLVRSLSSWSQRLMEAFRFAVAP